MQDLSTVPPNTRGCVDFFVYYEDCLARQEFLARGKPKLLRSQVLAITNTKRAIRAMRGGPPHGPSENASVFSGERNLPTQCRGGKLLRT